VADRGCWDLSRHAQFSGTELTHFKKFDEPKEVEADKVKAKHKALGPRFKDKAKAIAEMMEIKNPSDIRDGKLILTVEGEEIILDDGFFEVVKVREKISGERVVPHVIEPSHGLDRIFYSVLEHSYSYDKKEDYTVLRLAPEVAPIKVGVFPLMEKDGMDVLAAEIYGKIHSTTMEAYYDGSGTIGKRYARMDEVGTPWCITVDYESLNGPMKGTVTIRDRDTTAQKRIPIDSVNEILRSMLSGKPFGDI
jgi:glycyl-tRNA synthetase